MNRKEAYYEFSKILINDNDSKESYVHKTKYKNLIVKIYDDFEKKNTINVNVKLTDLEPFKDLIIPIVYWVLSVFIYYNSKTYFFKHDGFAEPCDFIREYSECIVKLKINDSDAIQYLNAIWEFLREEIKKTYGWAIGNKNW